MNKIPFSLAGIVVLLFCAFRLLAVEGQQLSLTIDAPSLAGNLIGEATTQSIIVYLPPSYSESTARYPVVYFLPGWTDYVTNWTNGAYQGFRLKTSMDKLITDGVCREMIVVIVSGRNFMGGGFYVNSPVTGNWEDFVTQDVIEYMDANYRTLAVAQSRGITGHSMGGFGALNLAMLHPELFSVVYALSPGLYDTLGLKEAQVFKSTTLIKTFIQKLDEWAQLDKESALQAFKTFVAGRFSSGDWDGAFGWAYGTAFSTNIAKPFPHLDYPYTLVNDELQVDSTLWYKYESGFGGVAQEVELYKNNLAGLRGLGIDVGTNDEYRWISKGCKYMHDLLTAAGIAHDYNTFNGGHENKVRERIETMMIPFMSGHLQFEAENSIESKSVEEYDLRLVNYPNPFNNATVFQVELSKPGQVSLVVYNLSGQVVDTLANNYYSQGYYSFPWAAGANASGLYIAVLTNRGERVIRKVVLSK
ncbi:MAG TPA: alpha/beta hydrolase-fold protein [bacterium]|nr:alpha/beta hydrolase-fold protein [bacterium]HPN42152.1 alpha/beta hydrolase-fold protein [bacterium]